mgnify:CR=1 FL=1
MTSFVTQCYNMGPLSSISLETTQDEKIYQDMIYDSDRNKLREFEYLVNVTIPSLLKQTFRVSDTV